MFPPGRRRRGWWCHHGRRGTSAAGTTTSSCGSSVRSSSSRVVERKCRGVNNAALLGTITGYCSRRHKKPKREGSSPAAAGSGGIVKLGATVVLVAGMSALLLPVADGFGVGSPSRSWFRPTPRTTASRAGGGQGGGGAASLLSTRLPTTSTVGTRTASAFLPREQPSLLGPSAAAARWWGSPPTQLLLARGGGGDDLDDDDDDDELEVGDDEEEIVVVGPDDDGDDEEYEHDEVDEVYEDEEEEYEEEFEYEDDEEEEGGGDFEIEAGNMEADYDDDEQATLPPSGRDVVGNGLGEYVEDEYVPLQDDPDDANYNAQKAELEQNLPRLRAVSSYKALMRERLEADGITEFWDKTLNDMFAEHLTEEELKLAEDKAKELAISEDEIANITEEDVEEAEEEIDALGGTDAFPPDGPQLEATGITNDMLVSIDDAAKAYYDHQASLADGTWEGYTKLELTPPTAGEAGIDDTDPHLHGEMLSVLKAMNEDGQYMVETERFLVYDLQFNVTNLFLAACKHNPEAPIILPQWLYELEIYSRYVEEQERNFEYTAEEMESADLSELESYWAGMGYDAIPTRTEKETNIVSVDPPDDDEMQMSHMQEWIKEVYDPEFEETFFDDDDFMPYESVYSDEYYQKPPTKEQVQLKEEMDEWADFIKADNETSDEEKMESMQYMEGLVSIKNFTERIRYDSPEAAEFQGHLVVACSTDDADLDIAEKITGRFEKEFGRKIFVETRAFGHAKPEDFLFEVWLESYDIDLLHSKRRATFSSQTWDGPPQCDDGQIDYLVDEVRYLISDEHRYSYRIFEYEGVEEG